MLAFDVLLLQRNGFGLYLVDLNVRLLNLLISFGKLHFKIFDDRDAFVLDRVQVIQILDHLLLVVGVLGLLQALSQHRTQLPLVLKHIGLLSQELDDVLMHREVLLNSLIENDLYHLELVHMLLERGVNYHLHELFVNTEHFGQIQFIDLEEQR